MLRHRIQRAPSPAPHPGRTQRTSFEGMSRRAGSVLAAAALVTAACVGGDADSPDTTAPTTLAPTTTTVPATTTTTLPIFPRISWSMPDRFGLDENNDGRIDVPNTAEYAHNLEPGSCSAGCPEADPTFSVLLSGADSVSEAGPIQEYRWEWRDGSGVVRSVASAGPDIEVRLPEGSYTIALTVTSDEGSAQVTETIVVRDLLIAVAGDSYASGEGNPESNLIDRSGRFPKAVGIWADGDNLLATERHRRAHRSTLAAGPQAALDLEAADDQSSVTLLFVAGSGASIDTGMMGPHDGVPYEEDMTEAELPGQIDELAALLGCEPSAAGPRCNRTIDALIVSIGGNDMGFGPVWGGLIAADPGLLFARAYRFALNEVFEVAEAGIRDLPLAYDELEEMIRARLEVTQVYLTAYPSPFGSGDSLCEVAAEDLVPGLEADRDELTEASERILDPLNQTMADAATRSGWVFVDSFLDDFATHGYCASDPYPPSAYPGNPFPAPVAVSDDPGVRWFRRAQESTDIQGVPDSTFRPADLATRGSFHPNELGHQRIKQALLAVLELD